MKTGAFFYAFRMLFVPLGGRKDNGKVRGAVFGIVLSLIPVVVAIQTASGMISGIVERYLEIGSFHITGQSYHSHFSDRASDWADQIAQQEGVRLAIPILETHVLLASDKNRNAVALKGVPAGLYDNDAGFRKYFQILDGRFDLETIDSLLVSDGIAESLQLKAGDRVRMLLSREAGGRSFLQAVTFTVTGIFTTGYYDLDHMTAYIGYKRAQSLFGKQGYTVLGIKLDHPDEFSAAKAAADLNRRFASEGISFRTWKEKNRSLMENLDSTFTLILSIAVLIILLAAVNIFSIMVAFELEKRSAVAVLRSLGVPSRTVFIAFLSAGFLIGICGTVIGLSLGLFAAVNLNILMETADSFFSFLYGLLSGLNGNGFFQNKIEILNKEYYLENIPLVISRRHIFLIAVLTVFSSGAAALVPAVAAAGRKPLDVMKDI